MGFFDRFMGINKKEYSIVVGGVVVDIDLSIEKNGNIAVSGAGVLGKEFKNLHFSNKFLKQLSVLDSGVINLDNPVFLKDKNNMAFTKRAKKMINQNMGEIIENFAHNKDRLKNLLDNDAIRSNEHRTKAIKYISVPDDFLGKTLYNMRNKYIDLQERSKGVIYEEPKNLKDYKKELYGQKMAKKLEKEEKKISPLESFVMQMAENMEILQKEIISLKAEQTQDRKLGSVEQKNNSNKKSAANSSNTMSQKEGKNERGEKRKATKFTSAQQKAYDVITETHKQFKDRMVASTGFTKQDYEGKFGINTIKKAAIAEIRNNTDPERLSFIRDSAVDNIASSYSRAVENKESKLTDENVEIKPANNTEKVMIKSIKEDGGDIEISSEDLPDNIKSIAGGGGFSESQDDFYPDIDDVDVADANMVIDYSQKEDDVPDNSQSLKQ